MAVEIGVMKARTFCKFQLKSVHVFQSKSVQVFQLKSVQFYQKKQLISVRFFSSLTSSGGSLRIPGILRTLVQSGVSSLYSINWNNHITQTLRYLHSGIGCLVVSGIICSHWSGKGCSLTLDIPFAQARRSSCLSLILRLKLSI
jgi:hypothetical protein